MVSNIFKISFIAILFVIIGCQEEKFMEKRNTLFESMNNDSLGVDFTNTITNTADFNIFNYRNFYNGGGVAIGDINNDGLQDVFLTSNMSSNKLYLNKGNWTFEDISDSAQIEESDKWSTGVVMVDINGDNYLDIYVCNAGYQKDVTQKNALFINNKDLSFTNKAKEYGLDDNGYTTHAAFFDYDRDGDLDVYLLNNSFIPVNTLNYNNKRELRADDWEVKDFLKGGGDKILRNDSGAFVDVSDEMGIYGSLIGFGLGVTVGDVNDDAYPDIYVSNDFFERDYLYINKEGKYFSEELEKRINHISHSSMGADMADINNDGQLEIFVTDMLPDDEYRLKTTSTFDNIDLRRLKVKQGFYNQFMHNTLQLNTGEGHFNEISFYADVAASDWSWGALMFDADNDGYNDIFVCNGIYNDVIDQDFIDFFANEVLQEMALTGVKEEIDSIINYMPTVPIKNKAFKNLGNYKFEDIGDQWGFDASTFSNGAAYGDLDNDGDYDLVINNVNQPALFYKNKSKKSFISFNLKGQGNNTNALGAKIFIYRNGDEVIIREQMPSRGFQSSVDNRIIIGLNDDTENIEKIEIRWPDGQYSTVENYSVNSMNVINENDVVKFTKESPKSENKIFSQTPHSFQSHIEDDFIDFYFERNIPNLLSREGPCSAVGDVNGDGQVDVFIGGAAGQPGLIYVYDKGEFKPTQQAYFDRFKAVEDTAAEFFDADGDGDLDLYVGSGGNNVQYDKRAFTDRLYLNNNGTFQLKFEALPKLYFNTSVIVPLDYDSDGHMDLFVGNRSIPGIYGVSPGSYIYKNTGNAQFRDVTSTILDELKYAGMLTDAVVADIHPNKGQELIIVGEWMSPKILSFNGEKFDILKSELDSLSGWWQSIASADLDSDGDMDMVIGNMGENFYLKPSINEPVKLWINDFDQNNALDKIITRTVNGMDMPVVMKRDLTDQLAFLKKENIKHAEYAKKSIHDLFTEEVMATSELKQINYGSSIIAYNEGSGNYRIKNLPDQSQMSCINEIVITDINNDSNLDIIVAGNNHFFLPQFSMVDACDGKLLLNDKNAGFNVIPNTISGLEMDGVVRSLEILSYGDRYLLALRNSNDAQLYRIN